MSNAITKKENRVTFSMQMNSTGFQRTIANTLQDPKRAARFTAAITSAVANQPELQACDASTILSSALLGESLNLSPSSQLGQFYMVPFNDNKRGRKVATFILGYKGYIQLALRSGYYRKLNVVEIKEGELISYDPLAETIEVKVIQNDSERTSKKTIGYYAMFEYMNGFRKIMYWSKEKMEAHALEYSKGYTFWEKDFDAMAKKTMLRQLISKWGIMSTDMIDAFEGDGAVVDQTEEGFFEPKEYPESEAAKPEEATDVEPEVQASAEPEQVMLDEL